MFVMMSVTSRWVECTHGCESQQNTQGAGYKSISNCSIHTCCLTTAVYSSWVKLCWPGRTSLVQLFVPENEWQR